MLVSFAAAAEAGAGAGAEADSNEAMATTSAGWPNESPRPAVQTSSWRREPEFGSLETEGGGDDRLLSFVPPQARTLTQMHTCAPNELLVFSCKLPVMLQQSRASGAGTVCAKRCA